ncbi:DUF2625 domain-containing protein [Rufibacter glacialis]|uniref:DUF2625 domain-containing protein n=1 Tax=Rufibacter glacialis TaxID=1259555 RepID=A0A5M8QM39_9BACT|nr:DUF2625 domain-containing protein [Rufibacter glacialis]KAA6437149.1 DUF2625 domain-containing protein [Rufibacter glacialis]GGK61746.1 hypothetical protein GCM10011405_07250 [Rufibacter glacialis]
MKYLFPFFLLFLAIELPAQTKKRPVEELIDKQQPGWVLVTKWIKAAKNKVEVLPKTPAQAKAALASAQVTTRSPMGAVVYETGGILVDDGWIRILGSGSPRLPRRLMQWNKGKSYLQEGQQPSFLLIADDALGGFYALNAGGLGQEGIGKVFYFSPDNLQWEASGLGYSEFLQFCFSGNLEAYYEGLRWKGWREEVKKLKGDQAMHFFPYLWTKEGKDINKVSRKPIALDELWFLYAGKK